MHLRSCRPPLMRLSLSEAAFTWAPPAPYLHRQDSTSRAPAVTLLPWQALEALGSSESVGPFQLSRRMAISGPDDPQSISKRVGNQSNATTCQNCPDRHTSTLKPMAYIGTRSHWRKIAGLSCSTACQGNQLASEIGLYHAGQYVDKGPLK